MAKRTICNVDVYDDTIRIMPTVEERKREAKGKTKGEKRRLRRARVYQWDEASFDVMFPKPDEKLRDATLVELKRFTFVKIFHSKHRVNIRLSFDKVEVAAAQRVMRTESAKWFEAINEFIKNEKL